MNTRPRRKKFRIAGREHGRKKKKDGRGENSPKNDQIDVNNYTCIAKILKNWKIS